MTTIPCEVVVINDNHPLRAGCHVCQSDNHPLGDGCHDILHILKVQSAGGTPLQVQNL